MLGAIDQTYLFALIEAVAAGDASEAVKIADDMQARSLSFDAALADLAALLLKLALAQTVPDALHDDAERGKLAELAARIDPESVQLYYQIALQAREDLPLAPDEHGGFVMTLLRMLAFRPDGVEAKSAPRAAPASTTPKSSGAKASGKWPELVQQLALTGAARELARNSELAKQEGNTFELVVPKGKAYLAERIYTDKLKAALEQHLGGGATLRVAVGETKGASAAALEAGEREARRAAAAQSVQSDGFVKDLVNLFDAKVVDSSIKQEGK
jgi:DNA polymerase-3 subunit gamma/tau